MIGKVLPLPSISKSAEIISNVSKSYECENSVKYIFSDLKINKKIEKSEILSKLISDQLKTLLGKLQEKPQLSRKKMLVEKKDQAS